MLRSDADNSRAGSYRDGGKPGSGGHPLVCSAIIGRRSIGV
jgi:hypothetical protein